MDKGKENKAKIRDFYDRLTREFDDEEEGEGDGYYSQMYREGRRLLSLNKKERNASSHRKRKNRSQQNIETQRRPHQARKNKSPRKDFHNIR